MRPALEALTRQNPELGRHLNRGWDLTLFEYSRSAWSLPGTPGIDPLLRSALTAALMPRTPDAARIVDAAVRSGAVLTPHHVCPTLGPTIAAVEWIAAAACPGPLLVLAWSGVAMSNPAASGALCFGRTPLDALLRPGTPEHARQRAAARDRARDGQTEGRIALVTGELRDARVYRCALPERVHAVIDAATPALRRWLPDPLPDEDLPTWSLRTCEGIQRAVHGREDLWMLDLNRVAADWLGAVLQEPSDHPLRRLLEGEAGDRVRERVPDLPWFYEEGGDARRRRTVPVFGRVPGLADRLATGDLCPGLVPVLGGLRATQRLRLVGGFRQGVYLEDLAAAFAAADLPVEGWPGALVTGRLTDAEGPIHPLDLVLGTVDRAALPGPDTPMGRLWEPLLPRLMREPAPSPDPR